MIVICPTCKHEHATRTESEAKGLSARFTDTRDQFFAEVVRLREAVKRAEWDFTALVEIRGDLSDESRAHETLRILRAALSSEKE